MYNVFSPFISLWLGSKYILSNEILILVVLNFFIGVTHQVIKQFLYGYGLFSDTWAPIVEACIFISISVIGGHLYGLKGILLGGIISQTIILCLWKPYFLFSKGFKLPIRKYWSNWAKYMSTTIISWCSTFYIISNLFENKYAYESWLNLINYICVLSITSILSHFTFLYLATNGMKNFTKRILNKK